MLTRFNKQIIPDDESKLPEEPSKEQIISCLGALNFSTHALQQAQVRKIPGKDVIFLAFSNIDISAKFMAGKVSKVRAFQNEPTLGLPAISVNYHARYASDEEGRLAQIRRSFSKARERASNPPPQTQTQHHAPPGKGNEQPPQMQEASGGGMIVAMEGVETQSQRRTREEAGLLVPTTPAVQKKRG